MAEVYRHSDSVDNWPPNTPSSLEDICRTYFLDNIFKFLEKTDDSYCLKPGITIPQGLSDKLLAKLVTQTKHLHDPDDNVFGIFNNRATTSLTELPLRYTAVSWDQLSYLCLHPVREIDIAYCTEIKGKFVSCINQAQKTLRVLQLGGNDQFERLEFLLDGDKNDSLPSEQGDGAKVMSQSAIFTLPNLLSLSLRDINAFRPIDGVYIENVPLIDRVIRPLKSLTHLDLCNCHLEKKTLEELGGLDLPNLRSLSLCDVLNGCETALDNLCNLETLRHLDVSQGDDTTMFLPVQYPKPTDRLQNIINSMPNLTSLDISGTNLAGYAPVQKTSHRLEAKVKDDDLSDEDVGLPGNDGRQFNFLGLLNCADNASHRRNIPAQKVTGDFSEEQILLAVHVYREKPNLLTRGFNYLFNRFRFETVTAHCLALEGILLGMERNKHDKHVQISGSASLFYIVKGSKKDKITHMQKRRVIGCLLDAMERHMSEHTMMRNGCLTLCHFNIPYEVLYCYNRLVRILLQMLRRDYNDDFLLRIGIFLLNSLACQVEGEHKQILGQTGVVENPEGADNSASASPASNTEPVTATERVPVQETVGESVTSTSADQSVPSPMETTETDEPVSSQTDAASSSTNTEPAGSTQATAESSTSTNQSTESPSTDQSNGTQQQNGSQQPRGPVRPNINALGEVLVEVNELNRRLQPHIERFTRIIQEDAEMNQNEQQENQRVCNMVSEAMHAVSHSYHAISDLMVDLSQNRPRQLYVTLAIAQPHTAVIQQTIPVQAQIQVGGSPRLIRRQFAANRATQSSTTTSSTASVSVPSTVSASASTTTSTGTSTGPQPSTTETGTQSGEARPQPPTSSFGAQHDAGLSNEEMQRLSQQMSAGLQNVLGQGLQQGDGTPDNPYVFVEMGPDSMTVNSISAEVVTTDENGVPTTQASESTAGSGSTTSTPPQPAGQGSGTTGIPQQVQLDQGQGLPPNFIQNLVQQIVSQTGQGQGQPQRMQINIGQGPPPMMGLPRPGMPMGIRLGPRGLRPAGTQTAGGNGIPANSGTQTSVTPTSVSGTQTTTNATPNSTSGTQTPGAPRAAAFVVPGMPGLAQNISPADQYLPCSSRHFLTQHARSIINQTGGAQNTDTFLADMVSNLMSGLLGGTPQSGAQATGSTTATTATGSTPTSTATTGSEQRPAGIRIGAPGGASFQFGGVPGIPSGIGGLFRGQLPFMQGMRFRVGTPRQNVPGTRPTAPTAQPATAGSTTGQSAGSAPTGTQGAPEPQFLQMLRTMLQSAGQPQGQQQGQQQGQPQGQQQGNQTNNSSGTQQSVNQPTGSSQSGQAISDEAFTQLVGGITGYMSQAAMGQAPRQTIAEFLSGLGQNYGIPQGEGFINDIMSCVLSHLQITDLISVFYGSPAPLNQVQQPLREFISTRVMNDLAPFPQNIRMAVEELVDSMQTEIQDTVNSTQPRPHIDFLATLNHFFNQQFYNIVSLVMHSRDGDVHFGQDLYACVRRFLSEMFILSSRCLGGMQNVESMVSQRLQILTTGVNPFIQEWMATMTSRQIGQFIPTINVAEGEISHYVVYKEVGQPSSGASASQQPQKGREAKMSAPKADSSASGSGAKRDPSPSPKRVSVPSREEKKKTEIQPMETCSPVSTTSPGASEVEVENRKPSPASEVKGAASADSTTKPTVQAENQPSPSGAQAVNGDWQSVLPPEWVPVITRDIEKQSNQPPQRPHSDVYLQGMPPKRRRLMTQDRPRDLSNTAEVLPESIRRAVAAAAVEPISSLENISSEITNDTELQQAYESNVSNTVSQRLENDKDFKPERFPNSEEYFHKGSDTKK